MLIFNNRKQPIGDLPRYHTLAEKMTFECLSPFKQYLNADVPCQKLTEGLESLYYALASYFLIYNNVVTLFHSNTKSSEKRSVLFERIWSNIMIIVNAVLKSFAVLGCKECGPRYQIRQCLCLDRIVVLWRIVYL